MNTNSATCYTLEAALEKGIELEANVYRQFLDAIRTVTSNGAREILRDAAAEELRHKQALEQAQLNGDMAVDAVQKNIPTMNLDHLFGIESLDRNAGPREALAHAIHLVNVSVQFYKVMTEACNGAPMATLFRQICNEQKKHLQLLEDSYEEHCLTEN